jgi:hypothetical protein
MLGAVAGGVALAASGLLLPEWLVEDAEADEENEAGDHPARDVQERKQRKRDKRRHKREHNRRIKHRRGKQGRKELGDAPLGWRDMAIVVHNYWSVPAPVKGWQVHGDDASKYSIPAGWDSSSIPAFDEERDTHSTKEFLGHEMDVAVQFSSAAVVRGQNFYFETPKAEILSGSWTNNGKSRGTSLLAEARVKVNESISGAFQDNRVTIRATRVEDTRKHIVISVDLMEVMNLSILVHNHRSVPVQVQGWQAKPQGNVYEIPGGWDWSAIPAKAADGTPSTKEFVGSSPFVVVRIGTDRFVQGGTGVGAVNPAVSMEINTGGWDTNGWNPKGSTLARYPRMPVNQWNAADGIKVTRIANGGSYATGFRQQLVVELS